jgi:putative membrane protein
MKRFIKLMTISLVTAVMASSCDDDDDNTAPNDKDKNFMTMAAYANWNEIDAAQLALTKSTNDSVKTFAQLMIAEHTTAKGQLDSVANQFTYSLPTTVDSAHAALKVHLMTLSGLAFDTTYMNSQVTDHVNTINLFQNEVNLGNNPSVKNYASQTLPHLQMHLQRAQSIRTQLQ